MKPALVSVVIPTFNRADLLRECLNSVAAQSYRPLEVIVADDGSTDDTERTVAEFRERSKAIKGLDVVYLPLLRGGAPKARNAGVARASGRFVQYLDSDDLLHPRKIELQVAAFAARPESEFVWGLYRYFDGAAPAGHESFGERTVQKARFFTAKRWNEIPGMVHIGLFRHEACARIGPWCETLARWQDVEYMMRFARLQPKVARLNAVLYYLRRHAGGQIQDLYNQAEGVRSGLYSLDVIEKALPAVPAPDPDMQRSMSNFYKSIAETALQSGLKPEFRAAMRGAVRHRPVLGFRLRAMCIQCVCSCFGSGAALRLLQSYHSVRLPSPPECVN